MEISIKIIAREMKGEGMKEGETKEGETKEEEMKEGEMKEEETIEDWRIRVLSTVVGKTIGVKGIVKTKDIMTIVMI